MITKKKSKSVPVIPYPYVVIEYQDGSLLSEGNMTKDTLIKIGVGTNVKINEEAYVVESLKLLDIGIYLIHVSAGYVNMIEL